jgi:hypothetical protein
MWVALKNVNFDLLLFYEISESGAIKKALYSGKIQPANGAL